MLLLSANWLKPNKQQSICDHQPWSCDGQMYTNISTLYIGKGVVMTFTRNGTIRAQQRNHPRPKK